MIPEVIVRLQQKVPALRTVNAAASLAVVIESKAIPTQTPAAYIVPLGLQAGAPLDVAGGYIQPVDELIGVVLFWRTHDNIATGALPDIEDEIRDARAALPGWAPPGVVGVFRLVRGRLISMATGTIIYQLDFAISDQLRIAP